MRSGQGLLTVRRSSGTRPTYSKPREGPGPELDVPIISVVDYTFLHPGIGTYQNDTVIVRAQHSSVHSIPSLRAGASDALARLAHHPPATVIPATGWATPATG